MKQIVMITLNVTTRANETVMVEAEGGASVMEAMRDAGAGEILALCGGSCACATCHVYIDAEWAPKLPKISEDEDELLSSSTHRRENSRLSCQILLGPSLNGLRVTIAPED